MSHKTPEEKALYKRINNLFRQGWKEIEIRTILRQEGFLFIDEINPAQLTEELPVLETLQ